MIVFDLICGDKGHPFEGWFSSSSDYEKQRSDGLINCPTCGSSKVQKAVMAPNVGPKGNQAPSVEQSAAQLPEAEQRATDAATETRANAVQVPAEYQELIGKLAKAQDEILSKSQWVGNAFPEKARSIHYGEIEESPIHGIATAEDAAELEEEGISIAPLPFPVIPPESQN